MKAATVGWWKPLSQLVMIRDRGEWDGLDLVTKWLIATRSAVTTVTIYSCIVGGLLAWRALAANGQPFDGVTWLVLTVGLFFAHGTNNLLNDLTDYRRGIDTGNYFRTQYSTHPLAQGFWSEKIQLSYFAVSGVIACLSGLYALIYTDFSPIVLGLFAFGALVLLIYTYPLKHLALGEFSIFLIWGPLMVAGVYVVLTGVWNWMVVLAAVPIGLSVASVNIGKHTDKRVEDAGKHVHTLPVLIGEPAARTVTMLAIVLAYLITLHLIFGARFFTPVMLLVLFAVPRAWRALRRLAKPRPAAAPPGYPVWPRWFSTICFIHNRLFSNLFVAALLADTLLRLYLPTFWR